MRKHCLGCVLKHLGSAAVLEHEMRHGYPHYVGYVIGELEQASQEAYGANRTLAAVLREHRIAVQYGGPDGKDHSVPFDALIKFVHTLATMEDGGDGTEDVVVPRDCMVGIADPYTGGTTGDTRK